MHFPLTTQSTAQAAGVRAQNRQNAAAAPGERRSRPTEPAFQIRHPGTGHSRGPARPSMAGDANPPREGCSRKLPTPRGCCRAAVTNQMILVYSRNPQEHPQHLEQAPCGAILLPCPSTSSVVFSFLGKLFSMQTKPLLEAKELGSHEALLGA